MIFCLDPWEYSFIGLIQHSRKRPRKKGIHVINNIIIHQTHYEKSDWSRAFNQFTIACELDMINAISAADIAFIMSSSTSAWLPSPWSVLLRNRMAECLLLPIV